MTSHIPSLPPLPPYPAFNLARLLQTVFHPEKGESVAILIDLENPRDIADFGFLEDENTSIQKNAYTYFYQNLQAEVLQKLGLTGGDIFAYQITGGSNLELPDSAVSPSGKTVSLIDEVYKQYDIVLCISTYSATAPLTAAAKQYGFRGATLHGLNDTILRSGLCVDYDEVSKSAEKLRLGMTRADAVEIDYIVGKTSATLRLELGQQEAQKSHGLCRGKTPDIANLPAGEIYFVPTGAAGEFPLTLEDGTIALVQVENLQVQGASLLKGNQKSVDEYVRRVKSDPAVGMIG
ncbi:MAG: hypothetical protein KDD60_10390, partial [Bdellovibrionales bacterium]|nr:hypothetical protein [Bdellovibrionales bacterium]